MTTTTSTIVELDNLNKAGVLVESHGIHSDDGNQSKGNSRAAASPPTLPGESMVATAHGRYGMSRTQAALVVATLSGVSFLNTMGSGILTVALPAIARDVGLDGTLLLWPASVYALAAGCMLLPFGAAADVLGARRVWLVGAALYGAFTLAAGLARTAAQLLAARAALGLAVAACLPAAVGVTARAFLPGRWRNLAFACQGMAQPLGYSLGLLLGGVLANTVGWRWGFHASAVVNALLLACALRVLPSSSPAAAAHGVGRENNRTTILHALAREVDWVGALTISSSLGLLSYVFSVISRDYRYLKEAYNIVLFTVAVCLVPVFIFWVYRQERLGRPALIPNSLWKNVAFTSICAAVFFTWAAFNAFQYFSALYFERVEHLTALDTSLRFLPMVVVGAATNIVTGFLVEKVEVRYLVSYSAIITLVSPLLMALVGPDQGYWKGAFTAMLLSPLHPDGGVFGAVSQVGNSVGLAVTAAISSAVTQQQAGGDEALLKGYHAAFWTCFAAMFLVVPITFFGLKKGVKVGASK